jgi:hypothetical protein
MMNVVTFKAPKFKPLPGELTSAVINGATLPVKIGIAQRAIAACCDLSELLTWKDKLAALAAAAKMARMPELSRDVNRVHKEAIFRMGEILLTYKTDARTEITTNKNNRTGKQVRHILSERGAAASAAGLSRHEASNAARAAQAPRAVREQLLQDDAVAPNARRLAALSPRRVPPRKGDRSDAAALLFSGLSSLQLKQKSATGRGLMAAAHALRSISADKIVGLTSEEKQRARKLVVEMQEILDDIDRRLGPDTSVESCK